MLRQPKHRRLSTRQSCCSQIVDIHRRRRKRRKGEHRPTRHHRYRGRCSGRIIRSRALLVTGGVERKIAAIHPLRIPLNTWTWTMSIHKANDFFPNSIYHYCNHSHFTNVYVFFLLVSLFVFSLVVFVLMLQLNYNQRRRLTMTKSSPSRIDSTGEEEISWIYE
jgi:hypothetical protein